MQHLSGIDRARAALEKGDRFPVGALPPIVHVAWSLVTLYGAMVGGAPSNTNRPRIVPQPVPVAAAAPPAASPEAATPNAARISLAVFALATGPRSTRPALRSRGAKGSKPSGS